MLRVDDIFISIQGESEDSGYPTLFIRFFGCPIGCSYCDQPQTTFEEYTRESLREKVAEILSEHGNIKHICITGGEPLLQEEVALLANDLASMCGCVSIETSGCVSIKSFMHFYRRYRYVMDVKCPSSGVVKKNVYENLKSLLMRDEVKFVIKDREDYDFMKKVLSEYPTYAHILVSPMFNTEGKMEIGNELVKWIMEDKIDCRIQIQLHKILGCK